ncbi:MAG: hypothetical protein EBU84_10675 [Actinobacteria bacterium]|jgi:hypothetical protein|nr:hypothetical protein [Actinomycetota bacterium]
MNAIDTQFKSACVTNTLTGELERNFAGYLERNFFDDGFSWIIHVTRLLGTDAEDFAYDFVHKHGGVF